MAQGLIVSTLGSGTLLPDGSVDPRSLQALLNDLINGVKTVWASGNTAERPVNPIFSQLYFDTQTSQYLYCSAVRNGATPAQWTALGTGSGGTGTVTSIDATTPIVVTPDPITNAGVVSHAASGVTAATYGDTSHIPQLTVNATGHVTGVTNVAVTTGGTVTSIDAMAPITVSPNPITSIGTISHNASGVTAATYGDTTHFAQVTVEADGHVTAAASLPVLQVVSVAGVIWLTMVGGGGGGATSASAASSGPGGGSGESCQAFQVRLTPGASISYVVGVGGATDTNGGDTTFGTFVCKGGTKGVTGGVAGSGGGSAGAAGAGTSTAGLVGGPESATYFGGSSGGGRSANAAGGGGSGGGSGGFVLGGAGGSSTGGTQGGGGGGAASVYGIGGAGGNGGSNGSSATSTNYGAGGGGGGGSAGTQAGGSGAGGYILIAYLGGAIEFTSGSGTWTVPS